MKKRIGLFVLLFVLVMSMVPVSAFAASSKKYTKVRESQYPKLMQGKLTKKQVEWTIESLVCHASWSGSSTIKLSQKQINKMGKNHSVNRIALYGAKMYDPNPGQYISGKPKDQWCEAHDLKQSNRILSFYTNYRYKKNKNGKENGYYVWRTNSKKLYYYGGIGWGSSCKITSARKYAKKMVLKVESVSAYDGNTVVGKYTVTLKKQKNGRFKLYSIKETWRAKSA